MSSIINKSGKRFTPKVKGRRQPPLPVAAEETAASTTTITTTITTPATEKTSQPTNVSGSNNTVEISEVIITDNNLQRELSKSKEPTIEEEKEKNNADQHRIDEEKEEEDDGEDSDGANSALLLTPVPTQTSRRSSTVDHTETRQRRLSTLTSTKPLGFGERRVSFTSAAGKPVLNVQLFGERRPSITSSTIIGIPQEKPPKRRRASSSASTRRRRSSATPGGLGDPRTIVIDGSFRRSSVGLLPTPPATQQQQQQETTIQEEQEQETPVVSSGAFTTADSTPPPSQVSKPATISTKTLVEKLSGVEALDQESEEEEEEEDKEEQTQEEFLKEAKEKKATKTTKNKTKKKQKTPESQEPRGDLSGFILDPTTQKVRKIYYTQKEKDNKKYTFVEEDFKVQNHQQIIYSLAQADPSLSENMTLDEEKFTIADLCKPTLPIGKVSSNYSLAREAKKSKMLLRQEKRKVRQQARLEKRSIESFDPVDEEPTTKKIKAEDIFETSEEALPNNQGIQLKLGADGNLVVDEESRIVDRKSTMDGLERERHDQNPFENITNSASYGRRRVTDKWDEHDVFKLYKALSQWGTDFGLIAQMFPHRSRVQVKNRFLLEERKRPRLVELALMNKLNFAFDFDNYCDEANKQFGTLDDFNEKLGNLKTEHEQNMKELQAAKEKAKEEDAIKQKQLEMDIKNRNSGASRSMSRQQRIMELRKNETVLGDIDDIKKQKVDESLDIQIPQE